MRYASAANVINEQLRAYNAQEICTYDMPHAKVMLHGEKALVERHGNVSFKREGLRAETLSRWVIGNKVIDHAPTWGIRAELANG